jgi:hypothetical protein
VSTPDLSEFLELAGPTGCPVARCLDQLDKADGEMLQAALDESQGTIPVKAVRKWLRSRGLDASVSGITHHRYQTCRCYGTP